MYNYLCIYVFRVATMNISRIIPKVLTRRNSLSEKYQVYITVLYYKIASDTTAFLYIK